MTNRHRQRVIVDTDIGTDIDDTWALAMLLKCPELDLRLVTTTHGDTSMRARIAAKYLTAAGRSDVPVGLGLHSATVPIPQSPWVDDYPLSAYTGPVFPDGVGALCDTILGSDDAVTLVGIGPQTNIAAALERAPEIAQRSHFVGMLGSIRRGHGGQPGAVPEWNVAENVEACRAVLSAPWRSAAIAPLDTCGLVRLTGARYESIRRSEDPALRALMENYTIWARRHAGSHLDAAVESTVLFDTVAIYLTFARESLACERLRLGVTDDGRTVEDPFGQPIETAMQWTDIETYLDFLRDRLLRPTVGAGG